jgi:hypothetical protein
LRIAIVQVQGQEQQKGECRKRRDEGKLGVEAFALEQQLQGAAKARRKHLYRGIIQQHGIALAASLRMLAGGDASSAGAFASLGLRLRARAILRQEIRR